MLLYGNHNLVFLPTEDVDIVVTKDITNDFNIDMTDGREHIDMLIQKNLLILDLLNVCHHLFL